jgi:ferric-dicitrate binding protein FerR (iron transport regulator)
MVVLTLTVALASEPAVGATPMLGQVIVKGQAKVNGIVTPSGANVFHGDQLTTGADSVAELVLSGGNKVLLPGSSAVVLRQEANHIIVKLGAGALAILSKNSSPAIIEAHGAWIRPAADTAVVLEIATSGNSFKVLARRGSATVEAANKSLEVAEGKELDATMAADAPQLPNGRPAGRNTITMWVFVAAVAACFTGLALGIAAKLRPNPQDCQVVSTTGQVVCP